MTEQDGDFNTKDWGYVASSGLYVCGHCPAVLNTLSTFKAHMSDKHGICINSIKKMPEEVESHTIQPQNEKVEQSKKKYWHLGVAGHYHCNYCDDFWDYRFTAVQSHLWTAHKIILKTGDLPKEKEEITPVQTAKREEIKECYDAILPDFMEMMALLGGHAKEKYGSWEQYQDSRLVGNSSPITHILAHITQYRKNKPYDRFDGTRKWHLIAVAYNAMMELHYELHPEKYESTLPKP